MLWCQQSTLPNREVFSQSLWSAIGFLSAPTGTFLWSGAAFWITVGKRELETECMNEQTRLKESGPLCFSATQMTCSKIAPWHEFLLSFSSARGQGSSEAKLYTDKLLHSALIRKRICLQNFIIPHEIYRALTFLFQGAQGEQNGINNRFTLLIFLSSG